MVTPVDVPTTMPADSRNDLIDTYFRALDENDPEIVRSSLADSFVYESLSGELQGFEGLRDYITDLRNVTNSEHEITRRIHDEDASVVEGVVSGTGADGEPTEAKFCDVFEFADGEEAIVRIGVYVNDA